MTRWRALALLTAVLTVIPLSLLTTDSVFGAPPRDFEVPNGYFYSQANGDQNSPWGYTVSDNGGDLFYTEFRRYGGVAVLGYPISRRFLLDGFPSQAFQKGVLQWRKDERRAVFVNVFDRLSTAGKDNWLRTVRSTPNRTIPEEPPNTPWPDIVRARQAVLDSNPAIKAAYFAVGDPILQYGLPTSRVEDIGNAFVVRFQRAVIQQWKIDVPWARAGQVTIANGGDIFKEAGLIDANAANAHPAPGYETHGSAPAVRSSAPAPSSGSAPAAAQATPAPTSGIVRQIDRQRRTMPAYLRETPGAQFILVKLHQRTACENAWMGIGFYEVLDINGKPLDNVIVRGQSGETIIDNKTGTKGPGRVEQWFYRGNWTSWVLKDEHGRDTTSDYAVNMDTVIFAITPEEQAERFCNGVEGLATNHYSYDVTFRKVR